MTEHITYIKPRKGWRLIDFNELREYRDLLYFLSIRGIKVRYAQSVLGIGWAVFQPLISTLIFTIVFGKLARIGSDGVPYFLFSLAALVPWTFFSNTVTEASNSLLANSTMISKVYFPRLILPLSAVFSKTLDFIIGFVILIVLLFVYGIRPTLTVFLFPGILLILLMTSIGLGSILAALVVQFRDIRHALTFAIQLLMYGAPVVYPTTNVPENLRILYALNPLVGIIEGFRSIFLHTQPFPWQWVGESFVVSICLFVFGLFYFRRMERIFADVV